MTDDPNLSDPSLYINRELSWLAFNERVLAQARSDAHPLLERVKFLAIPICSKRIYKIQVDELTTDISAVALPADGNLAAAGITPVGKSSVWLDLQLNTLLPNAKQAEKWEGMTIGPKLAHGDLSGYVEPGKHSP